MFRNRRRYKRRFKRILRNKYRETEMSNGMSSVSRMPRIFVSLLLSFIILVTTVFSISGAQRNVPKLGSANFEKEMTSKYMGKMRGISSIDMQYEQDPENPPVELIPVDDLNISQEDLSVKEEPKAVVSDSQAARVEAPSNEISRLVYGIDVSKWQGDIDWAQVKADGVEFAMIKMGGRDTASSGGLYVDSKFERNIQGAIANGIQVGVYFFSQAVNEQEAFEEASMLISYINKYQITYPVAFDWESADGYRVAGYGLSKAALTGIVNVFCDTIKSHGYTPMVYFCRSDWYSSVNGAELSPKYKSWLAIYFGEYYNNPDARNWYNRGSELPSFNYSYQMWQYTSRGHVAGINGYVDLDIAFFTFSNYKVEKTAASLTVSNQNITTNIGRTVNLMAGVNATNSIGYNASGSVKLVVSDASGREFSGNYDWVFSHAGRYTLKYGFMDPGGEYREVSGTLTVRGLPSYDIKAADLEYRYDSSLSGSENYAAAISLLQNNITAHSFEGSDLSVNVKGLDGNCVAGTYRISYYIEDGAGLSVTCKDSVRLTVSLAGYSAGSVLGSAGNSSHNSGSSGNLSGTGNTGTTIVTESQSGAGSQTWTPGHGRTDRTSGTVTSGTVTSGTVTSGTVTSGTVTSGTVTSGSDTSGNSASLNIANTSGTDNSGNQDSTVASGTSVASSGSSNSSTNASSGNDKNVTGNAVKNEPAAGPNANGGSNSASTKKTNTKKN